MNCLKTRRMLRCAAGWVAGAGLSLLCVCSYSALSTDGGGSRGGNPVVTGSIVTSGGGAAAHVRVTLVAAGYNPLSEDVLPLSSVDTTDENGSFRITIADSGRYNIEAAGLADGGRLLRFDIVAVRDSVCVVPADTLRAPGSIKIALSPGEGGGYVYVPGTTIAARLAGAGDTVVIDSVPAGILPVLTFAETGGLMKRAIRYDVPVQSGKITVIRNTAWSHCCQIGLNTSVDGADCRGNVYDFPVLVRLQSSTIDFMQMKRDGGDLRFTTAGGKLLPHEIESWNADAGEAVVWVKVDTIYGNDSTQSLAVYWGNPAADDVSSGRDVFSAAAGFQGVWHLGDAVDDPVRDATANGYHGMSPDTARPQPAPGVAGRCRVFNGRDDFITMPFTANSKLNFAQGSFYSVSAWVATDTLDAMPHVVVAKGYEQYFLRLTYFPANTPLWEFTEFGAVDTWQACTTRATAREWLLLTGVRQGGRQRLYCNGVLVDSLPDQYQNAALSRNTSYDLAIGKFMKAIELADGSGSYCFFKGSIDEVRISSAALSADWIRLCYMNQRPDDRLAVFK